MTKDHIRLIQVGLEFLGFEPGKADGLWGPKTNKSFNQYVASLVLSPKYTFDDRTEKNISTLLPEVQVLARKFMKELIDAGIDARIISGTRTYSEQDDLYDQGRTKPGNKVTNARSGYSNHNFGLAFDLGIFQNGKYLEESKIYSEAGKIGEKLGLSWGGRWSSFQDEMHFELRPNWAYGMSESSMLEEFRNRVRNKKPIF